MAEVPHHHLGSGGKAVQDLAITEELRHIRDFLNGYRPQAVHSEAYVFALRDTMVAADLNLPQRINDLAQLYAYFFEEPSLEQPLKAFLSDVSANPRLEAIALAAWEEPGLVHSLSIYALLDRSKEYREKTSEFSGAVDDAYGVFLDALDEIGTEIESDLNFINTRGQNLPSILFYLPQKLSDEEFMGVPMVTGSLRLLAIASVDHTGVADQNASARIA